MRSPQRVPALLILFPLLNFLFACRFAGVPARQTGSAQPIAETTPTATSAPLPPTESVEPSAAPTEAEATPAPAATVDPALPAPAGMQGLLAFVYEWLDRHSQDLIGLEAQLGAWAALQAESAAVSEVDINADGTAETLLLLAMPGGPDGGPVERALAVLQPGLEGYTLLEVHTFGPAMTTESVTARNLDGEGAPELVLTYQDCGAHTCFLYVEILSWRDRALHPLLDEPASIPYGGVSFRDADGDGREEMVLHGGTIGSVGAGPVQTYSDIYAWDGQAYRRVDTVYDPSPFRLHVFCDGDRALQKGDLAAAIAGYERVVNDGNLKPTGMVAEAEERSALSAFALYRLVTAYAAQGNASGIQRSIEALHMYRNHPCLPLAEAFLQAWRDTGSVGEACAAATAYAAAHPEVAESFGYYGYGNPVIAVESICPLQ
ncbi:MAG: hypothetical protein ACUVX9_17220 [Anaerolineae bacterium]